MAQWCCESGMTVAPACLSHASQVAFTVLWVHHFTVCMGARGEGHPDSPAPCVCVCVRECVRACLSLPFPTHTTLFLSQCTYAFGVTSRKRCRAWHGMAWHGMAEKRLELVAGAWIPSRRCHVHRRKMSSAEQPLKDFPRAGNDERGLLWSRRVI